ncbi:MAG TPA: type II toxin-antitoxin system CcdA family antitoxin [Allosphingosinicella sp.]|jgi:post-segregation antitoxin (ccd killing protein)
MTRKPRSDQQSATAEPRRLKRGPASAEEASVWLEANREAIDQSNAYVEAYGLPLAKYRQF